MERQIRGMIEEFVATCPDNRFPDSDEQYFADPLVGFAAASDPLFSEFKRIIGSFHCTPGEIMDSVYQDGAAATVICWVLPVVRSTRESNRREDRWPSREWALTRDKGEPFNSVLRRHVVRWLVERGYRAVSPQLARCWAQLDDPVAGIASTWSERHAAYAAGLGTFSLNDALITDRGIAHRIGSVVTDLELPPTLRDFPNHRNNCLWYRESSCGVCMGRCPVGAITADGHDKAKCRDYVYGTVPEAVARQYGVTQTGCGLCQAKVPCEAARPSGVKAAQGRDGRLP